MCAQFSLHLHEKEAVRRVKSFVRLLRRIKPNLDASGRKIRFMERQNVHNSRDGKVNFQFGGPENKCRGHEFVGGGGVWGHPSPKNFIVISGNNLWGTVFFPFYTSYVTYTKTK